MRKLLKARRSLLVCVLGGGLVFSNGCMNALLSIQICGVVVPDTICTPQDQLLLTYQFLEVPDFDIDPSCTIPFGCSGDGDFSFPFGGGNPEQPPEGSGGGGAGGGGGIGGGGGGIGGGGI